MPDPERETPAARSIAIGIFLVIFGLILAVLTVATLVGPIFGILLTVLGIYLLWTAAARGEPPEPLE
jgi:hypothetical protein